MNVTIGEFNYLREKMVKDLVVMLMERRGMTYEEAFRVLYQSKTFANLSNPERAYFTKVLATYFRTSRMNSARLYHHKRLQKIQFGNFLFRNLNSSSRLSSGSRTFCIISEQFKAY